ncbi:MAG: putative acetyltransferase [Flavobacterium sp.]|jgi:putative acetyltransferase
MMKIQLDNPENIELKQLLLEHHEDMLKHSPPESVHALDQDAFKNSAITFWTAWIDDDLAGCGALKRIDEKHAEIKSMRTSQSFLRKGVAGKLLRHILDFAKSQSYEDVSLETGSIDVFVPAQKLYRSFGFKECKPFSDYQIDIHSMYFTKNLLE